MNKSEAVRKILKQGAPEPEATVWIMVYILEALENILEELRYQNADDQEEEQGPTSLSDQ